MGNKSTVLPHFEHIKKKTFLYKKFSREQIKAIELKATPFVEGMKTLKPKDTKDSYMILFNENNDVFTGFNLYRKSLNFNILETIHAVGKFINYYEPNLIESCDCGKDI